MPPWKRCGLIFEQVQQYYRNHNTATRLTNLKISMFASKDKPHQQWGFLNAKGAECKHMAPALLAVCKQVLSEANEVDNHIVAALENIVQLTDLFDQCHMFLTPAEHSLALQKAELFLDNYDWLNKWALEEGRKLFHIVIKHHTFLHLVQNSKLSNPRFHWCFKSEDFVWQIN